MSESLPDGQPWLIPRMKATAPVDQNSSLPALVLLALGAAITAACAVANPESLHHFDDLTHYLFAKWAWQWPAYLIDEWGRPGFTALYFLPAGLSWTACRLLSTLLTAAAAWLAFRIAQRAGLRSAWAVIPLCYAQPLYFQLAQTTLTETPLAFYLTFAVYLAQRDRWAWSAAFISLATITRHEAAIFIPLWILLAWRETTPLLCSCSVSSCLAEILWHRRLVGDSTGETPVPQHGLRAEPGLWRLWPLIWAPVAVNVAAVAIGMVPGIVRLFEPKPSAMYGQGGWLTFFSRSMEAFGPAVMVLAIVGASRLARMPKGGVVVACAVVYFATHTTIRALGLFNSGGYARFLVPISPLLAVMALSGWSRLRSTAPRERRIATMLAAGAMIVLWLAMERQLALYAAQLDEATELPAVHVAAWAVRCTAALLALLAVVTAGLGSWPRHRFLRMTAVPATIVAMLLLTSWALCRPLAKPHAGRIAEEALAWTAAHGFGDREIISANMWVTYATGRALPPLKRGVRSQLEQAPVGSLFLWDEQFAPCDDDSLRLQKLLANPAFGLLHRSRPLPYHSRPYILVFEKRADGASRGHPLGLPDIETANPSRRLAEGPPDDYHAANAGPAGASAPAR